MAVRIRCITDPACVWSWAAEPAVRALMVEFGDGLRWTFVMGGLGRTFEPGAGEGVPGKPGFVAKWLNACAESGMPVDPRVWHEGPPSSSYPMCTALVAAREQGEDAAHRYLRALREGTCALRRKLDTTEALVEEARGAGLDVARFRVDLGSHATVEAFGADLEQARSIPDTVRASAGDRCSAGSDGERVPFPTLVLSGEGGEEQVLCGYRPLEEYRAAVLAVGGVASDAPRPGVLDALRRFGRMAAVEVAAVCDQPLPRAEAELAQLALDWRVRGVPVLSGRLWELA